MKKVAKFLSLILSLMMVMSLAACGGGGSSSSGKNSAEAKTPYSDGPQDIDEIINEMVDKYDLPKLSEEDKNYTINLGYYNCDHMAAAAVGQYTGIYKALGMKVKVTGNGNVPEAMSAGKMDVGYVGYGTTLSAVKNNVPLFYAADNHIGGSYYLVVSNKIKDPKDLVGKKIGLGEDPQINELDWVEWTQKLGIPSDGSKYKLYDMSDSDKFLAMKNGKLDAYVCCDPWASMAEYSKIGKIMAESDPSTFQSGHGTCCKFTMNKNFAEEHPALAERMCLAHSLCIEFMYEHPYYAAEIFSTYYNVPMEVAMKTYWRKFCKEGRTIRWDLNEQYMENQINEMRRLGVRDDINTVSVDQVVDTQYLDNSGADNFDEFIKKNIDPVFPENISFKKFKAKAYAIDGVDPDDVPEYSELEKKE